jgi:hypothetical protein
MKKLKFDTLFESLMMSEGTISNQNRFQNTNFNLQKIIDKLEDENSYDYKSIFEPFIERWKDKSSLKNQTPKDIKDLLNSVLTKIEDFTRDGVEYLSYSDLNEIINGVMQNAETIKTSKIHVARWSDKFRGLFQKMKDVQDGGSSIEMNSDEEEQDLSGGSENNLSENEGIKTKVLQIVQASDSMSNQEVLDYLVRRMGRSEVSAENILNSLISSGDLVQNEDGNLEVSRETKEIETFGTVQDDDLDIPETGIPFKEYDVKDEDEDVDAAFRDALESDPYKSRDY